MGGVLGNPRFGGFRQQSMGRKGYNDKIVPHSLTKHTSDVVCLWHRLKRVIYDMDPALSYTSVHVHRNFSGAPHLDKNDVTYQYALGLGDFDVGRLLAETNDPHVVLSCDTRRRPTRLGGHRVHWVAHHAGGDRYSLIMFR
jgi:hypothetical protein